MTTRLTPAQRALAVLGRLSTMCCSHLVPGDQQRVQRGHDTQNPSGCPILLSWWHHLQNGEGTWRASRVLLGGLSIPSFPKLLQSWSLVVQWDEELRMPSVLEDLAESPQCFSPPVSCGSQALHDLSWC